MTYVAQTIPNLINGISQQPDAYRLPTQSTSQLNGVSSVVTGLRKRPPTIHVANLQAAGVFDKTTFIDTITYDEGEFYTLAITPTSLYVFDSMGVLATVTTPSGSYNPLSYLTGLTNPAKELSVSTIADHTYIINKNKKVAKSADLTPTRPHEGLVYIKNGDYKTEYKVEVKVGATTYSSSYTTRNSSDVAHEPDIKTTNILSKLYAGLSLPSGFTKKKYNGNLMHISSTSTAFILTTTDDRGGSHLTSHKGQVARFDKLPPEGPLGFKIKVIGENEREQDDYYVELADPEGDGNPVWIETTASNIEYKLDETSLPHRLIKDPTGAFLFEATPWVGREAGDEDTNPFPSFIGKRISDCFFYRNRFGMLADENVLLSEVGEPFNYFQTTTLVLSDAAPIDIAVSTNVVNILRYAIPFDDTLMLFSDSTQFTLSSGQVLAHDTVTVDVSTRFEADLACKPIGKATFVFFATRRGVFGGLREYYVVDDTSSKDAENVTSHVPDYIKGGVKSIAVSSTEDMAVMIPNENPNELYIYNYFWIDGEKKQNAWHKWDVGDEVLSIEFINSMLYLTVNRPGGATLETINLSVDPEAVVMEYGHGLALDRRVKLTTASPTVPYTASPSGLQYYNILGELVGVDLSSAALVTARGLAPSNILYAGYLFDFNYRFSEFVVRDSGKPVAAESLKIKSVDIQYDDSSYFDVAIVPVGLAAGSRTPYIKTRTPLIGSVATLLNKANIDSGRFKVAAWGKADQIQVELQSRGAFPCSFQSVEWTASFVKHARTR